MSLHANMVWDVETMVTSLANYIGLLQRASDVEAQLSDEQAKTMRLEVTVAELQQRLSKMDELEKELEHHR